MCAGVPTNVTACCPDEDDGPACIIPIQRSSFKIIQNRLTLAEKHWNTLGKSWRQQCRRRQCSCCAGLAPCKAPWHPCRAARPEVSRLLRRQRRKPQTGPLISVRRYSAFRSPPRPPPLWLTFSSDSAAGHQPQRQVCHRCAIGSRHQASSACPRCLRKLTDGRPTRSLRF